MSEVTHQDLSRVAETLLIQLHIRAIAEGIRTWKSQMKMQGTRQNTNFPSAACIR